MKTYNPKELNLTTEQREELLAKNMKNSKRKWKSQLDEAAAVGYDDEEKQLLITGKLKERIDLQYSLRRQHVQTLHVFREITELRKFFLEYDKTPIEQLPKWYGIPMPKGVLEAEFVLKEHNFKLSLMTQNVIIDRLKNVGFNKKQIDKVLFSGEIISDLKKIEAMEKEHEKKNNKKGDIDGTAPEETVPPASS